MCPEELVDRFYAAVYNLAYRTLGRREDAEDVAQQTFAQALPHLDDLRQPHAVGGWLLRIAANITLDELRRRGRRASLNEDPATDWSALPDPDRLTAPAGALELHELRVDVWRAALALPPQQRLALALREMHGMRYAEIADALHITLAAVETLLFRARQGFRRAYAGVGEMPASSDGTCRAILVQLSASIDGELEQREHEQVADHLRGCPTCQIAARELRATSRLYSLLTHAEPRGRGEGERAARRVSRCWRRQRGGCWHDRAYGRWRRRGGHGNGWRECAGSGWHRAYRGERARRGDCGCRSSGLIRLGRGRQSRAGGRSTAGSTGGNSRPDSYISRARVAGGPTGHGACSCHSHAVAHRRRADERTLDTDKRTNHPDDDRREPAASRCRHSRPS